ncbi:hypothetical protein D3C84_908640 [compost metagenome]
MLDQPGQDQELDEIAGGNPEFALRRCRQKRRRALQYVVQAAECFPHRADQFSRARGRYQAMTASDKQFVAQALAQSP